MVRGLEDDWQDNPSLQSSKDKLGCTKILKPRSSNILVS